MDDINKWVGLCVRPRESLIMNKCSRILKKEQVNPSWMKEDTYPTKRLKTYITVKNDRMRIIKKANL